jgi:hypothetical protein
VLNSYSAMHASIEKFGVTRGHLGKSFNDLAPLVEYQVGHSVEATGSDVIAVPTAALAVQVSISTTRGLGTT